MSTSGNFRLVTIKMPKYDLSKDMITSDKSK